MVFRKGSGEMAIEVFNRHEGKFIIDDAVYEEIQARLLEHMELDEYNKTHEFYTISNIYFDTKDSHLIRTSLSKPEYKEKLRLRAYGVPGRDAKVYLEIKKKVCGLVNKRRTKIALDEAYEFVKTGEKPEAKAYMNKQVLNEIQYILKIYDLEPRLYLAYDRKAMFGKENRDLRITFDTNIRSRRYDLTLESGDHGESLLEKGKWLMEVKAEKNIPLWLSKLLSENKIFKTSYSKYGKEYEKMLINNKVYKGEKKICLNQYSVQYQAQQGQLVQQYQ
jgi:SPX domain protein involved in polyphosphate accumulation